MPARPSGEFSTYSPTKHLKKKGSTSKKMGISRNFGEIEFCFYSIDGIRTKAQL
jgi:hypothetical protein